MDSVLSTLQSRQYVLGRRLQQGNNLCDNLVLALDGAQGVELFCTDVDAFLSVSGLQFGLGSLLSLQVLSSTALGSTLTPRLIVLER